MSYDPYDEESCRQEARRRAEWNQEERDWWTEDKDRRAEERTS